MTPDAIVSLVRTLFDVIANTGQAIEVMVDKERARAFAEAIAIRSCVDWISLWRIGRKITLDLRVRSSSKKPFLEGSYWR